MQAARNRYFPHNSWELCTAYSKRGRGRGGLEALARKFDPVSKTYFLHTSCVRLSFSYLFVKVISIYAECKVRRSQPSSWLLSNSTWLELLSCHPQKLSAYKPSIWFSDCLVHHYLWIHNHLPYLESQWSKSSPIMEILLGPFLIKKSFLIGNSCSFVEF
jgi:hypothetical protein